MARLIPENPDSAPGCHVSLMRVSAETRIWPRRARLRAQPSNIGEARKTALTLRSAALDGSSCILKIGKTSIIHSEDPLDKARVLNRAAERLFEKANEKTLDQVIDEAAATTGAGTDPRMLDAEAIDNWLAGIIQPPRCALADIGGGPVFN